MCRLSITSKRPSLFYNNTYTSITFVTFNATTSSTTFANYNNTIACLAFVLMMVVNDNSNNSNNNNFNYISYCSNETHLPLELTSHTHTITAAILFRCSFSLPTNLQYLKHSSKLLVLPFGR